LVTVPSLMGCEPRPRPCSSRVRARSRAGVRLRTDGLGLTMEGKRDLRFAFRRRRPSPKTTLSASSAPPAAASAPSTPSLPATDALAAKVPATDARADVSLSERPHFEAGWQPARRGTKAPRLQAPTSLRSKADLRIGGKSPFGQRRDDEYRSVAVVDDAVRNAAQDHRRDPRASAAAQHNQLSVLLDGGVKDSTPDGDRSAFGGPSQCTPS
jgi:hypothetical protein